MTAFEDIPDSHNNNSHRRTGASPNQFRSTRPTHTQSSRQQSTYHQYSTQQRTSNSSKRHQSTHQRTTPEQPSRQRRSNQPTYQHSANRHQANQYSGNQHAARRHQTYQQPAKQQPQKPRKFPVALALVALVVVIVFVLLSKGIPYLVAQSNEADVPEQTLIDVSYTPSPESLDTASSCENGIECFSLISDENASKIIPELTEKQSNALNQALGSIQETEASVGFIMVDLQTGAALGYNLDKNIYGASSFKGPYSVYVCEQATSGSPSSNTQALVTNAITWSDNTSYYKLRNIYNGESFNNYLSSIGMDASKASPTFPTYSVRDSAKLWMHNYDYLTNTNDETAQWLADKFKNTNKSFIRNGVTQANSMTDSSPAVVMNKAGWCTDDGPYNAVVDAGLVEENGRTYLISIMTGMRDSESHEELVSNLAATLYSIRGVLAQGTTDEELPLTPYDAQRAKTSKEAAQTAIETTEGLREHIVNSLSSKLNGNDAPAEESTEQSTEESSDSENSNYSTSEE